MKHNMKRYLAVLIAIWLPFAAFASPPMTVQYAPNTTMYTTSGGTVVSLPELRAIANVAASQTDSNIVTAVAGKKIKVLAMVAIAGATATTLTFNSKPSGAGVAISPLFANGINNGEVLPFNPLGWFETVAGEGLTVTTGAGSTTGILVTYVAY